MQPSPVRVLLTAARTLLIRWVVLCYLPASAREDQLVAQSLYFVAISNDIADNSFKNS